VPPVRRLQRDGCDSRRHDGGDHTLAVCWNNACPLKQARTIVPPLTSPSPKRRLESEPEPITDGISLTRR